MNQIQDILKLLATEDAGRGWQQFLEKYSDLVYSVVLQFENDPFIAEDCYLHICEKLSQQGFRRILKFRTDGAAEFHTWLAVVVSNLCVDWHRSEYGRIRALKVIQDLPRFEQLAFKYRFINGLALHECFLMLKATYPEITEQQFSDINARVNRLLTSRQHWRLGAAKRQRVAHDDSGPMLDEFVLADGPLEPDPEIAAQLEQDSQMLGDALSRLNPLQRLVINLRFRHELTLEEVAMHAGLTNLHTARRLLDGALHAMGELMKNNIEHKKSRQSPCIENTESD